MHGSAENKKGPEANIVALVLAGGEGSRLYPLTAEHAKPALPFVNGYRIVDFVLSNLLNSGIRQIYVLAQYKPESLMRHIDSVWTPWFSGADAFIRVLLPAAGALAGQFRGTADAVYQNLERARAHRADLVAVFAADHIYRMDVMQMARFHLRRGAEASVGAVAVPIEHGSSFGIIGTGPDGRVHSFSEKPARPFSIPGQPNRAFASMGNYLFNPDTLEQELRESRRLGETDFGRDLLPRMARTRRIYAYDFAHNSVPGVQAHEEPAYWRDVGTLTALAAAQQDAMGARPRFDLGNRHWPIRGQHDASLLSRLRARDEEPAPIPAPALAHERAAQTDLVNRA